MIETNPAEVIDFSYGITDFYSDGVPQAGKTFDNFFIDVNRKPFTRWGSVVVNDQLPLGAFRINKFATVLDELFAFQDRRCYFALAGVWTEVQGPAPLLNTFLTAGDSNSVITDTQWHDHLFFSSDAYSAIQKLYKDGTGNWRVRNAGLPLIDAGYSIVNPTGAGESYLYAFCLKYTYTVGTITYIDRGPVFYYASTVTGGAIGVNTAIISLPSTYTPHQNWDVPNWKLEIYRTATNGTEFYYVTEVAFGTATYNDNNSDASITNNESLYTTGDVASNGTPPIAKYVHCVNGFCFYANIKIGTSVESTLVRQSKFQDPDSVPEEFFVNTEQPIRGLSSIFDRPLLFCDEYVYRIDNYFGDTGDGGTLLRRIDDKAGCVSSASIVRTHLGIFWAGTQGFYWSDGFRVVLVSKHLPETYKTITRTATARKNIVGTYEPVSQRITWTASKVDILGENDTLFILDLKFPFIDQADKAGGTFTTMSGGMFPTNFKPTQVLRIGNDLYRGDARGYVLKHSSNYYTDPKIDTSIAAANWNLTTIIYNYASCFLDFGSKFYRKFVPRILISAANTTNLSMAITSSNDNNRVTSELKPLRYTSNITWGDSLPIWGDPEALWNLQGFIEEWRRFPSGGLRCNYKQVGFTNAKSILFTSDLLGTASVDVNTNTATLGGSYLFPNNLVDYFIKFEHDGYSREYKILQATTTTIVYEDLLNNGPTINGQYKWTIVGYPKGEVLYLNGYIIHWALISKSQTPFTASSLGSNPA